MLDRKLPFQRWSLQAHVCPDGAPEDEWESKEEEEGEQPALVRKESLIQTFSQSGKENARFRELMLRGIC